MPAKCRIQHKVCEHCGSTFERKSNCAQRHWAVQRFCSQSCGKKHQYDLEARLERNSIPEPNSGCWIWMANTDNSGYGRTTFENKSYGAHRLSFFHYKGIDPADLCVCHRCDTPLCINPDHLFLGTHQDNSDDKFSKGRGGERPRGSGVSTSKLTPEQVAEIVASKETARQAATRFGVNINSINNIRQGRNWSHLTGIKPRGMH